MSRTTSPPQSATPLRTPQLDIRIPPLHERQEAVALDPARFKVVVCGRQWGKTVLGAIMCVKEAVRGGHVWWVAPTYPIGQLGWDIIDRLCRQVPGTRFEGRPVFKITFATGGTIQLRSADNPDSLRGATLDGVVFDEAALAKPEAWPYLRPTLSVRKGWAMFISTPKSLNWFYDLYQDAEGRKGWARWRFPSVENPHLSAEDVAMAREEMSSLLYSQEYEAEFVSYGSGMFRQDWVQHYRVTFDGDERIFRLGEELVPISRCRVFQTVDLAWTAGENADYTVISTWAITPKAHLLLLDVDRDHYEGPDIPKRLQIGYERWRPGKIGVEKAAAGAQVFQEALRRGLPVVPLKADKDKTLRAIPATARMEQMTVWFPPASTPWFPDIAEELLAFPAGRHDDFVDTLAYACLELALRSPYEERGLRTV